MNTSFSSPTTSTIPSVTPSPNEDDSSRTTLKLVLAISYLVLFVIGTVGNGTVILMIINILTSMKRNMQAGKRKVMSNTNHVFIYVLGLSIVDLLVILHLPFLVKFVPRNSIFHDFLSKTSFSGQWLFGVAMCKVYWFGESVNKLLSSFLMTVLSWDRYMAVCSPVKSMKMRSNATAMKVLLACTLFATVLLLPVLIEAAVLKIDKMHMVPLLEGSDELAASDLAGTTISKCIFDADATFTLYTFVIGFAAPAFLIIIFYAQVTKRIVAVILFYFLCWTPQWTLNIMSQFNLIAVSWMTPALSAMFFVAHLLVCFNSAANPVLYAYINRELRTQHVRQCIENAIQLSMQSRPSDASATVFSKFESGEGGILNRLSNFQHNILASIFHRKRMPLVVDKNINIENTSSSTDEDKDDYL
ncbi:Protein CBG00362 [Caenorhabditis briggsae]|uniref:Protein CBG00362 n=1 Tax=Caenorhabditis briggsae TaxID=6238 RepID=A8WMX0_CAEBR|nr:Protein CBG00362 [Caenorhabditis briggsae]CAP21825.2 Protein CBG00362 [Caenorhabditis briggsae]